MDPLNLPATGNPGYRKLRSGRSSAAWRELLVCTSPGADVGRLGLVDLPQVTQRFLEVIKRAPELAGGDVEG